MTPDLSIHSTQSAGQRIAANSGLIIGAKALGVIMGLGSLYIATQNLSVPLLGVVLFIHTYMLFFSEVATFKGWQAIIRFGTAPIQQDDAEGLVRILKFGLKLDVLAALLGYGLAIAGFALIIGFISSTPELLSEDVRDGFIQSKDYIYAYCTLILLSQRGVAIGIYRLFDKFHVLAAKSLIAAGARFVAVCFAAWQDGGLAAYIGAWYFGSLVPYLFIPLMAAWELKKRHLLGPTLKAKISLRAPGKGIWGFVIKTNIDSTLAAAQLHGAASVSIFRIAEQLAKLLSEGFVLLDQVIYPELAKLITLGQTVQIWRIVFRAAIILLAIGSAFSVLLVVIGPDLLGRLLSTDYTGAAPMASLLVPAAALLGLAAPLYPVLYATDRPERAIYARGAGLIVYIATFLVAARTIGALAPGWAAIAGNICAVAFVAYLAKKTLEAEQARTKET